MPIETGELSEWDDAKGFGFIHSATGPRLFVHISAFDSSRRPLAGDHVEFERGTGRDNRPAAIAASIVGVRRRPTAPPTSMAEAQQARAWRLAAAAILLMLLVRATTTGAAPDWLLLLYVGMGALSALAYWLDKRAAAAGGWRVAETSLHAADLFGGVIGGLLAQAALHHKTAKLGFSATTALIVLLHLGGLGLLIANGMHLLPSF